MWSLFKFVVVPLSLTLLLTLLWRDFTNCFPASTFDFEQVIPGWNGLKILYIAVAQNKHFMIELQGQNYTFIFIGINFILRTMTMKPPKKQKHVQAKNRL